MTDDLDTLRPEVREAINRTDMTVEMFDTLVTVNRDDYDIIRAELLRLAADRRRADVIRDSYMTQLTQTQLERGDAIQRAEKAEAELAALKARIAEAPEYRCEADIISGRDGDYISAVLIHDDNAFQYPDVDGKRVRLVVEE